MNPDPGTKNFRVNLVLQNTYMHKRQASGHHRACHMYLTTIDEE